jgi:hypothetical protein
VFLSFFSFAIQLVEVSNAPAYLEISHLADSTLYLAFYLEDNVDPSLSELSDFTKEGS